VTHADLVAFLEEQKEEIEAIAAAALATSGDEARPNPAAAVKAREQLVKVQAMLSWAQAFVRELPPALPKRRPGQAQLRAIAVRMVATGYSSTEIAEHLGVTRQAVNRWRLEPDFIEALRALQAEADAEVHDLLVPGSLDAMRALHVLMTGPGVADHARVSAIQLWMELRGRHKNAPVAPPAQQEELDNEEDLEAVLGAIPTGMLERHLAGRKRAKERDL
jgi:hypothetical protein